MNEAELLVLCHVYDCLASQCIAQGDFSEAMSLLHKANDQLLDLQDDSRLKHFLQGEHPIVSVYYGTWPSFSMDLLSLRLVGAVVAWN